MTQKSLAELAREGNPKAIVALLNRNLQKHKITAKVDIKGDRLKVLFEADQVPSQERMYAFMQKGIESLNPENITKVSLYGKTFDQDFHEWEQSFEIKKSPEIQLSSAVEVADKIRDIAKARTQSSEVEYESPFLPTQKIENQEIDNSAYCPNCGSSHLQIRKDSNVSWGRAAVGWALFGAVGGAVGAITGEDRNSVACLNCGTSWKAKDLYKIRETIKELTGKSLNLSQESDRYYMNSFVGEIGPILESINKLNKQVDKEFEKVKSKENEAKVYGCYYGCVGYLLMTFAIFSGIGTISYLLGFTWFLAAFLFPIVGIWIGASMDRSNKKRAAQSIAQKEKEVKSQKAEAENQLREKLEEFISSHY